MFAFIAALVSSGSSALSPRDNITKLRLEGRLVNLAQVSSRLEHDWMSLIGAHFLLKILDQIIFSEDAAMLDLSSCICNQLEINF